MAEEFSYAEIEYKTCIPFGSKLIGEKMGDLEKKFGIKFDHYHPTMKISQQNRKDAHKKLKIKPQTYIKITAEQEKLDNFKEFYDLK